MKWIRWIIGQQPELRIIALLLAVIAYLLFQIWVQTDYINQNIPEPCGDRFTPCEVNISPSIGY